jgi:acyl transferase domain-containing protein
MGETGVTPVAVIDAACRLPGGVDSPGTSWEAVLWSDDMITEIPSERWDAEEHYDPEHGVPGRSVSRWGGFLDDVMGFDAPFFGFGEREAAGMDPHHRLLLENSWEAVEHAGLAPPSLAGFLTGLFAGLRREAYKLPREAGALEGVTAGAVVKTMQSSTGVAVALIFSAASASAFGPLFFCSGDAATGQRREGQVAASQWRCGQCDWTPTRNGRTGR